MTKVCTKCGEEKLLTEYYKRREMRDGRAPACRTCSAANDKVKRERRPPEYKVWSSMRERCNRVNAKDYPRYGGRGIKVCPEWDSFKQFYADMGSRPTPEHQIDRIDNDGNYESENCHWVTRTENARNRSDLKLTMEDARDIRALADNRLVTQAQLSIDYNIGGGSICQIVYGTQWREMT